MRGGGGEEERRRGMHVRYGGCEWPPVWVYLTDPSWSLEFEPGVIFSLITAILRHNNMPVEWTISGCQLVLGAWTAGCVEGPACRIGWSNVSKDSKVKDTS